jgi:hypothetical protein
MEIFASRKRISDKGRTTLMEYHINDVDVAEVTTELPGNRIRVVKFKDGVEPKTTISDELLQRIVRSAFTAGENWARQYHTWFTPTADDHKKMLNYAVQAARKVVKRSNSKKG